MRSLGTLVCQIPARAGSKRVKAKNLRYLGDRPLLAYAIACAQQSGVFNRVVVNTDGDDLAALAQLCGAEVYRRPPALAGDETSGDEFNDDFLRQNRVDTCVMVSPVCPLLWPQDIQEAVEAFAAATCDTLISCQETQMQTFCQGRAVNIDPTGPLWPTQRNPVVQILSWAVTIWDAKAFLAAFSANKSGYLGTHRLLWPLPPLRALKISNEGDFTLAEALLTGQCPRPNTQQNARYWQPSAGKTWS